MVLTRMRLVMVRWGILVRVVLCMMGLLVVHPIHPIHHTRNATDASIHHSDTYTYTTDNRT